jgi:transketolase
MMNTRYNTRTCRATKEGFAEGLLAVAIENSRVTGLGGDITASVGMNLFAEHFPDRFFSLGIAEQNAVGVAAGMALEGLIPVFSTYGVFSALRTTDQIRISLCYNGVHAIIGGAHAGISVGSDGATHQALEDLAIMRVLPGMTVLSPCDATQTALAIRAAVEQCQGPVYLRYGRSSVPDFTLPDEPFVVGKGVIMHEGEHACIIATGHLVWEALQAAYALEQTGIITRVVNLHTIKPLDMNLVTECAARFPLIITAEEHQIAGGLGGAVAEVMAECPASGRLIRVGIHDRFGESGPPEALMTRYNLTASHLIETVRNNLTHA